MSTASAACAIGDICSDISHVERELRGLKSGGHVEALGVAPSQAEVKQESVGRGNRTEGRRWQYRGAKH